MTKLIGLVLLVLHAVCVYGTYDWQWMDCHNGTFIINNGGDPKYYCKCNPGWGGIDCSLCLQNDVCTYEEICDKTLLVYTNKSYNCTAQPNDLIPSGSATAQFTFQNSSSTGGTGVLSVFNEETGAPFLFNCTFTACSHSYDTGSDTQTISCAKSNCMCSTWCNAMVKTIVNGMKGTTKFVCDTDTRICVVQNDALPVVLNFDCTAAGCQTGAYHPSDDGHHFPKSALIAILVGSGVVFVIAGAAVWIFLSRRRERNLQAKPRVAPKRREFTATLTWESLSCSIKVKKRANAVSRTQSRYQQRVILNDLHGAAFPGQVMAIVGPSGAGKTTFIDILAGRKNTGVVSGTISINGRPRDKSFKRISGYVLQDDKMLGTMTVKEHLMFAADLRLPSKVSYLERLSRVEEVLEDLGISHIAESPIGTELSRGISGGERRRLAIATELVTDPAILFLDEPTSGLDSYNAFTLMETLKRLAKERNRTIIVSIHQPRSNIYEMFDSLVLLAHGELVYCGTCGETLLQYFTNLGYQCPVNYNPADYLIDLVTMNSHATARKWARSFKSSPLFQNLLVQTKSASVSPRPASLEYSETNPNVSSLSRRHTNNNSQASGSNGNIQQDAMSGTESQSEYASSWIKQCWILSKRTMLNNLRNPHLLRGQYLITFALGVLLGTIYWHVGNDIAGVQNRAGSLFFMISLLAFASMSSIDLFFQERVLFVRERGNGMYCTSAYFAAKTLSDVIPMRVIPPLIMGSISYYMIGLNNAVHAFLVFLMILILVSVSSTGMCLAISAFTPSLSLGNLIAILLLLFNMLFAGFLVSKTNMPGFVGWLKYLSFLNFGFEVLMVNELTDLTVRVDVDGSYQVDGKSVLDLFDMKASRYYVDIGALCAMIVGYLALAYLFLRFVVKERR